MAADLGKLFGRGSVAEQLIVWAVLQQVIGAVLAPELELLQREVNKLLQATPLTGEQLADMVVKGHVSLEDAESYAKESGLAPADFRRLVDDGGEPPGLEFLLQAFRRGFIPEAGTGPASVSLEQGIRESRLKDKWIGTIKRSGLVPIPAADAVDAVVEGQIDYAQGEQIAYENGLGPADFRILVNTRGNPPSPTDLLELVRRGVIPVQGTGPDALSLQQGIFEGATKDKWEPAWEQLVEVRPPPRTVVALLRAGVISDERAAVLFKQAGYSAEMAQASIDDAHHQKLATTKELAKGVVDQLYHDQVVGAADATTMYEQLGYTAHEVGFLLAVQDLRREVAAVDRAIERVHTLYVNRHIDKPGAVGALGALHVPAAQQQALLETWDVERTSNVKLLTAAEIANAYEWKIMSQDQATSELVALGYTPWRAWILLSVRKHAPQPNRPAPDPLG